MSAPGNIAPEPPELPALREVEEAVAGWAATDPRFASMLSAGQSVVRALEARSLRLMKENRAPEAVQALVFATALAPQSPECWSNVGSLLDRLGSIDLAVACLERSVALSRNQPDTWLVLGLARRKKGGSAGAEAAYRTALELEPERAVAWGFLGMLREEQKDFDGAIRCLANAIRFGDASAATRANLGRLYYQVGRMAEARAAYGEAARLEEGNALYSEMLAKCRFFQEMIEGTGVDEALANWKQSLGPTAEVTPQAETDWLRTRIGLLSGFGHKEAALRVCRKLVELEPDNAVYNYLLQAAAGGRAERSPSEYISQHFNEFADGFDAKLVGVLGYDIPEKLCALAVGALAPGRRYDVLDAGCGTGLCGPALRAAAGTLAGVDLAAGMIEHARRRGVYDSLHCGELLAVLGGRGREFDLVVAADVLVYLGELGPFFDAAARGLRPGGLLAFSTELLEGGDYRLLPSGRFAHAPEYVRELARPAFEEEACQETTIRLEGARRLPGQMFLFRRKTEEKGKC